MLAESADACAMATFRSAASASTRQRASLRKPAGPGPVASTRSRIATGPGTAPRLTSSNACAGFEAAWCWLLKRTDVDRQEHRRERAPDEEPVTSPSLKRDQERLVRRECCRPIVGIGC